jgi:general secretion pathway protein A
MSIFESFGLKTHPFSEVVDPANILKDGRFKSVFDPLSVLPEVGSMAMLTGRTGVGKTTLLRQLISTWRVQYDVHYIHLGNLHSLGLMRTIITTVGERPRMGKDRMFEQFYAHLSKKQRPLCLIIDEAQLLDIRSMTDLRVLCCHIELANQLILVLSGQPPLNSLVQASTLTDLRERMSLRTHLPSMTLPETIHYIDHRLKAAGAEDGIFDEDSVRLLHHHGEGVPRRIHQVAIKAMMNAWSVGRNRIDEKMLREACAADRS